MAKSLKDHSKTNWTVPYEERYPGDNNIIIGCMQRIAASTEAMANNHIKLQQDLDWYMKRYTEQKDEVAKLCYRIRALKANITKLKKKNNNG